MELAKSIHCTPVATLTVVDVDLVIVDGEDELGFDEELL